MNQRRRPTNRGIKIIIYFCEIMQFLIGKTHQLHVAESIYAFEYVLNISIREKIWFLKMSQKKHFFLFFRKLCLFVSKTHILLSSIERPSYGAKHDLKVLLLGFVKK